MQKQKSTPTYENTPQKMESLAETQDYYMKQDKKTHSSIKEVVKKKSKYTKRLGAV